LTPGIDKHTVYVELTKREKGRDKYWSHDPTRANNPVGSIIVLPHG